MKIFKQIIFFLAIAIVVNWLCYILQSTKFAEYLRDKLLELLIYIMAINIATISVLVTKLYDIEKLEGVSLKSTIKEVKISMIEQIILIVAGCLLTILYNSPIIKNCFKVNGGEKFHEIFFNTLFTTIFIYSIDILRDTGMAIFEVVNYPNKKPK
jgi:hypothetical protein